VSTADLFHEEEALGKAYDARLMRRLWPYVRPYAGLVVLSLGLVVPLFAAELAPAWIIKQGLDRVFASEGAAAGSAEAGAAGGGEAGAAAGAAAGGAEAASEAGASALAPAAQGWAQGWAEWIFEPQAGLSALAWLAVLYAVAMLAQAGLRFANMYVMAWTGQLAMRDLRRDVFDHIQALHLGFFDRYPVGRLVTRATNDVENVAEMFSSGIIQAITDLGKMAVIAAILFAVNAKLALFTLVVVPVLAAVAVVFRLRVREAFRETRVRLARINAMIQETITGMKEVQLFSREERNLRDFDEVNAGNRDAFQRSNRWDAGLFSAVEMAQNLTVAIILGVGFRIATVGTFYVFIEYLRLFFQPLRELSAKYSVMQSSMASAERIFQLLETRPQVVDRGPAAGAHPQTAASPASAPSGGAPRAAAGRVRRGEVELDDVWFAYNDEEWVLRGVSFRVAPGERVALVGHTGAGKTSVVKLLTRLYEPQRGAIRLDGVDVRDLPQAELRRRVATVLQDVFLFSGTVAENIGLGRDDLGPEALERAARSVEAHRFVERLPQGYQTVLRERGADLSLGQRQLLSFARAVAHDPDVLVLDEATSAIDTETEAAIQRGIHALMEGRTALAIAHRLSTIRDVDRIYVLHRGCVVERGRHEELLAQRGVYHRLYQLQYRAQEGAREATRGVPAGG